MCHFFEFQTFDANTLKDYQQHYARPTAGCIRQCNAFGFSVAFQALCNVIGLRCLCVEGLARGWGFAAMQSKLHLKSGLLAHLLNSIKKDREKDGQEDDAEDINHCWNVVCVEGRWVLVDVAWGASELRGGVPCKLFNPAFFDCPPALFAASHFPVRVTDSAMQDVTQEIVGYLESLQPYIVSPHPEFSLARIFTGFPQMGRARTEFGIRCLSPGGWLPGVAVFREASTSFTVEAPSSLDFQVSLALVGTWPLTGSSVSRQASMSKSLSWLEETATHLQCFHRISMAPAAFFHSKVSKRRCITVHLVFPAVGLYRFSMSCMVAHETELLRTETLCSSLIIAKKGFQEATKPNPDSARLPSGEASSSYGVYRPVDAQNTPSGTPSSLPARADLEGTRLLGNPLDRTQHLTCGNINRIKRAVA